MAGLTLARDREFSADGRATRIVLIRADQKQLDVQPADALPRLANIDAVASQAPSLLHAPTPTKDLWRMIAPGVMVRDSEYQLRFGHLDLETLRSQLSPAKFAAFVRHIGVVRGREDSDVAAQIHDEAR